MLEHGVESDDTIALSKSEANYISQILYRLGNLIDPPLSGGLFEKHRLSDEQRFLIGGGTVLSKDPQKLAKRYHASVSIIQDLLGDDRAELETGQ